MASAIVATFGSLLLARFVGPRTYGELATVLAICAVLSALASGRIETALYSAADSDLPQILLIGIANSLLSCGAMYAIIIFLTPMISSHSHEKSYALAPVLSFFVSSNQCLRCYDGKVAYSKHIEPIKLIGVAINYLSILILALIIPITTVSLVSASISSELLIFLLYLFLYKNTLIGLSSNNALIDSFATFRKYTSHMIHDIPSAALNILGQQAQTIALSLFISPESAGLYSLAKKPYVAITQFFMPPITSNVRNVFLQSQNISKDFLYQSKRLLTISFLLGIIALGSSFALIHWMNSSYSGALIFIVPFLILYFFKNWVSPLTIYLYIAKQLKENLFGQLLYFCASIAPIFLLVRSDHAITTYTYLSSLSLSLVYVYYYIKVRSYANKVS